MTEHKPRMQVVFVMAGAGWRFRRAGFEVPKPMIQIRGRPMLLRLLDRFPKDWRFVFLCGEEHRASGLPDAVRREIPSAEFAFVEPHRKGPAYTVRQARGAFEDDSPTLLNYCDFDFEWSAEEFEGFARDTACDGAVLCYRGFHPHHFGTNVYAYCRVEDGRILEVREKRSFTEDRRQEFASTGTYYFRTGALAKEACARALERVPSVGGEHYISETYNPLLSDGLDIRVFEVPRFAQWGTPDDLADCLYWEEAHRLFSRAASAGGKGPRLLMPMAGLGKRFGPYQDTPKPLRQVLGEPMFRAAMRRIPASEESPVFVLRKGIADAVRREVPDAELVLLDEPTAGQAVSCLAAEAVLDPDAPLLVSACDHGLLWDPAALGTLISEGADAAVFGQRGYPGARRSPRSFSYIDAGGDGRVRAVSVKLPLGDDPRQAPLLTGTFYFRKARFMLDAARALVVSGEKRGGEFYLDAAVDRCVAADLDVRCFETQAYLNWGSPDALREFEYWGRYFEGREGFGWA